MNAALLLVLCIVAFVLAYRFYARFIARVIGVDDSRVTPAHDLKDGIDYSPARAPVLLGHHFSSIAGAAPIIGPVTAAAYGWAPVVLWIVIGAIFLGAVHDLTAMVASVRHQGLSIGEVIEGRLGRTGKILFLVFCWAALILVIAVFAAVVAKTFIASPASASASVLYLVLALVFGLTVNRLNWSFMRMTAVCVPLLFVAVWLGLKLPLELPDSGVALPVLKLQLGAAQAWVVILMAYVAVASVTPVTLLLQPRDYLSSFLLYALILVAIIGTCVAAPAIKAPALTSFTPAGLGSMFPMLFVLVACGAVSGFHSLVASGTSAKQLNRERDAVPVAYGSMLIEATLAVIALICAVRLSTGEYAALLTSQGPIEVFAAGVGSFSTSLGIPQSVGLTFATLAVSAFALTTLDTATRLARFCAQEMCARPPAIAGGAPRSWLDRYSATLICVVASGALALSEGWKAIWPLFGAANQLLAALALLTVSVWLYHRKRPMRYTLVPAVFMFAVTLSALFLLVRKTVAEAAQLYRQMAADATVTTQFTAKASLAGVGILLLALALVLVVLAVRVFMRGTKSGLVDRKNGLVD